MIPEGGKTKMPDRKVMEEYAHLCLPIGKVAARTHQQGDGREAPEGLARASMPCAGDPTRRVDVATA
jgi:hypothetical protein